MGGMVRFHNGCKWNFLHGFTWTIIVARRSYLILAMVGGWGEGGKAQGGRTW